MVRETSVANRSGGEQSVRDLAVSAPAWLAVASLAISTFASVTTEFLPIGLLTNIATSLHISEGVAGLMITMPGLIAALTGPVPLIAAGRLDRRTVLLVLSSLLVISNLLAALAPNLATMLLARILLGMCVGGFWTFAPGATGHLVPAALQPRAMSYILAGISVATIAGVPAGAFLGNMAGWRMAFVASAVLATTVLVLQTRVLPPMPPARAILLRDLLAPLSHAGARSGLIVTVLLVAGHFAAYTYLRPMLQQVFGLSPDDVTTLLLVYGVAGVAGTFLGGRLATHSVRGTSLIAALMIATVLLFSALAGKGLASGIAVAVVWGAGFGLVPVSMTTWMLKSLPDLPEAGQAMMVSFFQFAISLGALVGGLVVDGSGVAGTLLLGGGLCVLAAAVILLRR